MQARHVQFYLRCLYVGAAAILASSSLANHASAAAYKRLHFFCKKQTCPDGQGPESALVADAAGNLYGTATDGGQGISGTIFELTPRGRGKYAFSVLYRFSDADGVHPDAGLVVDVAGNLYGVATQAGPHGAGTAFELVLNPDGSRTYKILYAFCSQKNCSDGELPYNQGLLYQGVAAGVPYDGVSPLYGTTYYGGSTAPGCTGGTNECGLVYQLTPAGGTWTE